jgi:signal transduction histidine kinase
VRRRVEVLVPVLVLVGFVTTAVVSLLLLTSAQDRGVDALEASLQSEIDALAATQDQRLGSQLQSSSGLLSDLDLEVVQGSPGDQAELDDLLDLIGEALQAGFFIVDPTGRITNGVLLQDAEPGDRYDWPGLAQLAESPTFALGVSGVLGLGDGITTDQPVLPFVVPIRTPGAQVGEPGEVLGLFVLESPVSADSSFNQEIGTLHRGETGRYLFIERTGAVIAANDPTLIASRVDDERLLELDAGLHRYDGSVVVVADVPATGWRVAFRQEVDEFEEDLAGPLESVGRIVVLVLLLAGLGLMFVLYRRLRAARAEQERLEQLSASQQEFISIVSHELRTPVAGVLGFLETSLDHWDAMDDAARRSAVSRAAANARRLQAMTRDVLDTQSLETGQLVQVLDRVDLVREVTDAVDAVRGLDAERELVLEAPAGPVWVSADADRIQQVLANLIDNARKHSPVVEPVEVTVTSADGEAHVTVRDRGAGIPDEALERIFDKFVRGRGESVTGTGLGLYISRQIVSAHGGRIWAESEGGGATFHVVLPLVTGDPAGVTAEVVNT